MKIVITGATGLIGRQLALRLRRDGHEIVAWVRSEERARQQLGAEVCLISEDGAQRGGPSLEAAVSRADAVINLAGEPIASGRWSAPRKTAIYDSRINLTRRLVNAMEIAQRRPSVLISASAVGFYGDRGAEKIDEEFPAGEGFLADVCRDWEDEARAAESLGVRVVLPRIGIVLARDGGALAKMLPPFRAGLGGPLGDGRQFMPWIHLDDLVELLATALTDGRYRGALNATGPTPVTNRVFSKTLGRVLRRPAFFRVPGPMLSIALGQLAQAVLQGQRAEPKRLGQLGFAFRFGTIDAALRDLLTADDTVEIERLDDPALIPQSDYTAKRRPRYLMRQRTVIDAPIDQVFPFFSQAANLGAITPPGMSFAIQTPAPIAMGQGTVIDYRIKLGPLPMPWRTVIERWEPGVCFVDAQHRGPYRCWWHEHHFRADGHRTIMEDRVYYAPPLGLLGRIANRLFIAPMLKLIFGYRRRAIRQRFGEAPLRPALAAA
jgi:uncharacterized protein (TIGR01777 family)